MRGLRCVAKGHYDGLHVFSDFTLPMRAFV
jgi:hypothetical protein